MADKIPVLFIQSQAGFGADSLIQAEIARHLDRDKFVVHVACTRGDGSFVPPSLEKIRQIPDIHLRETDFVPGLNRRTLAETVRGLRSMVSFPSEVVALCEYIKQNKIRILHCTEKPRDALYAVVLGKLTGAKSIVHVHVKWSKEYTLPARASVQYADAALAISQYVRDTIVDMGKPAAQVPTVLNALDASGWDPDLDGSEVRRELGISPEAPVIASISRLFSWKGPTQLLDAAAIVAKEFPGLRVLIVGADEVYVHGGSYTAELKAQVKRLGIEQNVIFTGHRRDAARILAASDLFTMPSFEEPFGVVFLEAMAMRKPVIGIDNGGTPEVVTQGKAGLLSPPWDVPTLADNIIKLLRDADLRRQMGEYGRKRVLEYFNPQRMARETGDVYERLLAQ
jgi:glycosyltransferase involved in cell wall biosynthesis